MKKNNTMLVVLLVCLVVLGFTALPLSTLNPGFEGAKCNFYGTYVGELGSEWTGDTAFYAYNEAKNPLAYTGTAPEDLMLVYYFAPEDGSEVIYWTNIATPNDAGIGWAYNGAQKPEVNVHVENNVQLQDITRQGDPDPLNFNDTNPLGGQRIEYWSMKGEKVTETDSKVIYEYELTKESFLIVPAEFWVGFSLTPSQSETGGTASGWREGEYYKLTAWFRLDFHVWDNAYYDDWMNDPQAEVYTTEYGGTVTSTSKLLDPDGYRGGFPITGWIQGWEKAGWTSAGIDSQSPVWYDVRSKSSSETFTNEQLWNIRDKLMSKVAFTPGLVGTHLSLYDAPDASFSYEPDYLDFGNIEDMTGAVRSPDSAMHKTMYFPINIENFGTYAEDQGWWGLLGWKVYYPSAYFRIRMIYGVYGSFKYLWTEEVTKPTGQGGLNYPTDFERAGTTVITTTGALTPFADLAGGIASWFSSPFSQLWIFFIIIVIVIIIVTALNPNLWNLLLKTYSKRKGKR